jgi:hypothetical protein
MKPSTSRVKLGTYIFKGVNKGTIPHLVVDDDAACRA